MDRSEVVVSVKDYVRTFSSYVKGHGDLVRRYLKYAPWLPLHSSYELCEFVSLIMGDGNISKSNFVVNFYGYDKELIARYVDLSRSLFGLGPTHYEIDQNHSKNASLFDAIAKFKNDYLPPQVGRTLFALEVPKGDRVLQSFDVPPFVENGDLSYTRGFLRGLFSTDASHPITSGHRCWISFSINKCVDLEDSGIKYVNSIMRLLRRLDIYATGPYVGGSYFRSNGVETKSIYIRIASQESLKNFHENVGYIQSKSAKELSFELGKERRHRLTPVQAKKFEERIFEYISSHNGVTIEEIAEYFHRSKYCIEEYIQRLRKRSKIRKKEVRKVLWMQNTRMYP